MLVIVAHQQKKVKCFAQNALVLPVVCKQKARIKSCFFKIQFHEICWFLAVQ
jgi:hypothetical protein